MHNDHLDVDTLERILRGELDSAALLRSLIRHLLALCSDCQGAWDEVVARVLGDSAGQWAKTGCLGGRFLWEGAVGRDACERYAEAFERALARCRRREPDLHSERQRAPGLIAELWNVPEDQQKEVLSRDPRFHTWGMVDLLIRESYRATFEDPAVAQTLAGSAVAVAEMLDPAVYSEAFRQDVLALAWAYLGNARRVASDLRGGAAALRTAEAHLARGVGDPLARAEFLHLQASLCQDLRRFEEAHDYLDQILHLYRELKDSQLEGRALVQKAGNFQAAGEPEAAEPLLRRALTLLDREAHPRLILCTYHNLVNSLTELGKLEEAEALLAESRPLYADFPDFSTRQRLRWIEGRLAAAQGRVAAAEAAFLEVRQGFVERGVGYDAALVCLDLAGLYAAEERAADVKVLAEEMLSIFHSRDVHREAMAALLIFQQAAQAEEITVRMVEQMVAYLRRARHNPELRYEEPS